MKKRVVLVDINANLRSDECFRKKNQLEHHSGTSILERLRIDMVQSFPLDYTHLTCLGVMRKLLWAWIKGSLNVRIGLKDVERISENLIMISSFVPTEYARKSRSLKFTEMESDRIKTIPSLFWSRDINRYFETRRLSTFF